MNRIAQASLVALIVMQGAISAQALENTFTSPTYKRVARLDNCQHFGKFCGQPAADDYCRIQGYERASRFATEPASPTRVINFGQECRGPGCVGFRFIVCFTSAQQRGPGRDWPHIIDD
jgi:hypothetical protein